MIIWEPYSLGFSKNLSSEIKGFALDRFLFMYSWRILIDILSNLSEFNSVPVWVHIQPIFTPFNITLDRIQSSKDPSSSVQTLSFSLYLCTHLQRSTSSKKTHVYPGKIDACMLMCVPSRQELPLKPPLFQTAHTLHIKVLNFWRGRDIRAITYFVRPQHRYTCSSTREGGWKSLPKRFSSLPYQAMTEAVGGGFGKHLREKRKIHS